VERIFNFSAGPAVLPLEVLQTAKNEIINWHGCGISVMEMSHRGKEFTSIIQETETDLRELVNIPGNYKILFLTGGATSQFSMVPMNLLRGKKSADYINTGIWSKKAIKEAQKYCEVNIAASSEDSDFTYAPTQDQWTLNKNSAYVHYTPNETIGGVEFNWIPNMEYSNGNIPLVADMSSNILSRQLDITKYGLIYAGAQKNIGVAGLTIVIVREDLLGKTILNTPSVFNYKIHADNFSMYNTPPTYTIYIAGLIFKWLKKKGGLAEIEKINSMKAALLYNLIDATEFYICPVKKSDRSRMNVSFRLKNVNLDKKFLEQAKNRGLVQLKGHRAVGGMRASLYNAMPIEGVRSLIAFMKEFANNHA
tara:strand:- start:1651 stop:2745 length:1095 start_codon:yes stop_codon:yes gene_type:complete